MSTTAVTKQKASDIIEAVIAKGDISQLTPQERAKYYVRVCESVGLNPMTRPFEYLMLSNKLTLYAGKNCAEQLRSIHDVSINELSRSEREGVFIVTAKVSNTSGRTDVSIGAVSIQGLKGESLANAMMKAETKAKRRATLSICGLGMLDETEIGDIPGARHLAPEEFDRITTGPQPAPPPAERRGPGRPRKTPPQVEAHDPETGELPPDHEVVWSDEDASEPESQNAPAPNMGNPDVLAGYKDAQAGRTKCLNPDIRRDPARLEAWRTGFLYGNGIEQEVGS